MIFDIREDPNSANYATNQTNSGRNITVPSGGATYVMDIYALIIDGSSQSRHS